MNTDRAVIQRLSTGVEGLDEVLGGGLPDYSFNIIAGAPGSGKTTLAHQIMFALATREYPALYFTVLGEPPLKMLRYQQQFDFFDHEAVGDSVRFISLAAEAAGGDLDDVLERISAAVQANGPGLVFIDSFLSIVLSSQGTGDAYLAVQKFVQRLALLITSWQAVTFLIGEYLSENENNPVFTSADGLIWLKQSVERNSIVRKLEVTKMRGQATLPGLHTFRIGPAGIKVVAPVKVVPMSDEPDERPSIRVAMGVPGLDEMMGGGLPRGCSLLVAGPSGSGKSILASAFLVEGTRRGEIGVIAAFEQRSNRSRGGDIQGLVAEGKVGVVDTRAADLSVDEMAALLITEIRRLGAARVVIDSLSGFELSLAPTFRGDFRESMSRMVSALSSTGATILMTSELEDRYGDLRFSPYGTAFLTDAIIVQRYIEVESRLERVMAVVKVRGSAHSSDLRLFSIDDRGIVLGTRLDGYEGLLGGRPTRQADFGAALAAGAAHD